MVAYSFQKQFVAPILSGTKRQTIRAESRKRHARPGEEMQLYTGMRTKHCKLIARATCESVDTVTLEFHSVGWITINDRRQSGGAALNAFARADGFASWEEMRAFWRKHHPGVEEFDGMLIRWGELLSSSPLNGEGLSK